MLPATAAMSQKRVHAGVYHQQASGSKAAGLFGLQCEKSQGLQCHKPSGVTGVKQQGTCKGTACSSFCTEVPIYGRGWQPEQPLREHWLRCLHHPQVPGAGHRGTALLAITRLHSNGGTGGTSVHYAGPPRTATMRYTARYVHEVCTAINRFQEIKIRIPRNKLSQAFARLFCSHYFIRLLAGPSSKN